eukprot:4227783-Pyramimonas_sp.AAC.2
MGSCSRARRPSFDFARSQNCRQHNDRPLIPAPLARFGVHFRSHYSTVPRVRLSPSVTRRSHGAGEPPEHPARSAKHGGRCARDGLFREGNRRQVQAGRGAAGLRRP